MTDAAPGPVALFIAYRTKPGQRAALREAWQTHVRRHVESNPALLAYHLCDDDGDADVLRLYELYADRAALDALGKAPWLAAYNAAIQPLLAGTAEVAFASPRWIKDA